MKSASQLNAFFAKHFADAEFSVVDADNHQVLLGLPVKQRHLRPGGTVSGPTLMALADAAAYAAVLAAGGHVQAVTSQLHIHFLRRPSPRMQILALARLQHQRGQQQLIEVSLYADTLDGKAVAVASVHYANAS